MRSALYSDKKLIVDILSASFDTNKSVNFVAKQDAKRKQRIKHLMAYSFEICWMFGQVYLSEEGKACALVLLPENKRSTLKSIWLDLQLALSCIGIERTGKVTAREQKIKAHYPKEPTYYLWFIGVVPECQKMGIGRKLLEEILEDAKRLERPVCLETSMLPNVDWYKKQGFKVYATVDVGYPLFMMRNDS